MTDMKVVKVAKYKCLKNLLFHTRYFFKKHQNKKFVIGEHHEIICNALEKVLRGEIKRLIINIAPRYGKTELAVKSLISHGLALNPAAKFIHLSYSDTLALDNSESVKDLVQSAEYQQLFPEVQVKKDSKAKDKWYTTAGGGVLARSASGQVTGFGAGQVDDPDKELEIQDLEDFMPNAGKELFGGAIIIDDPIKPEDADSDVQREKVNQRYDSTIKNRVNSRNTPIIVIMQRLHPQDLAGYLQREEEEDKWTVISLPCIKEDGTALWPFKHTIEELKKMEKANDIIFHRQYMQNAKPKHGLLFPKEDLNFYKHVHDEMEDPDFIYMPVDPANLGGDDFAGIICKLIGKKIFVTDVLYNTEGSDINEKAVVNMILRERVNAAGIEGVFGWAETVNRIRAELEEKEYEGEVRSLRPRTSKHSRILSRSAFIRNHFYFRDDYNDFPEYRKFMQNLTSYLRIQAPGLTNKHDEAPDVCEMGASYFERNFAHLGW